MHASELGNVIGLVSVYIYMCVYKKIIEQTRDLTTLPTLMCWSGGNYRKMNSKLGLLLQILLQPSSAAVERVFLLLNKTFNDKQQSCLEDCTETSLS